MKILRSAFGFLLMLSFSGCASLWDAPKNIVGVSIRDMEDARGGSIYQSYACTFEECFKAVAEISAANEYNVFLKDGLRGVIVLMNVPKAVETTEVGVFFTVLDRQKGVKVEVSSRSSPAKRTVAVLLFAELTQKFSKI